jgi:hypothetical protein
VLGIGVGEPGEGRDPGGVDQGVETLQRSHRLGHETLAVGGPAHVGDDGGAAAGLVDCRLQVIRPPGAQDHLRASRDRSVRERSSDTRGSADHENALARQTHQSSLAGRVWLRRRIPGHRRVF